MLPIHKAAVGLRIVYGLNLASVCEILAMEGGYNLVTSQWKDDISGLSTVAKWLLHNHDNQNGHTIATTNGITAY